MQSDLLRCDICFEGFDTNRKCPRILKDCGHSYCSECIKKTLESHGYCIECGFCRTVTYGDEVHDFPKNFLVLKQINHKPAPIKKEETKKEEVEEMKPVKKSPQDEPFEINKIPRHILKVALISLNIGMVSGLLIKKSSKKAAYFTLYYLIVYVVVKNMPVLDSLKKFLRSRELLTSVGLQGILQICGILTFLIIGKIKKELNAL